MTSPSIPVRQYQSHTVSKALCTVVVRHRLSGDASALLHMFIELLNNKGGLIDLNETRWDSRSRWCQYLNIEADAAGMKRVTRAFSRLSKAGLLFMAVDKLGRTIRRLTSSFKKAVDSYRFPERKPVELVLTPEPVVEKPLPQSRNSVETGLPQSRNPPSAIAELELDKGTKKLKSNTPPDSQAVALKIKVTTFKGLYGLVKSVSDQYVAMETCEGFTKEMIRKGYEFTEIIKAVEIVRDEIGDSGRCITKSARALTAWFGYCETARKQLQLETQQ